MEQLLCDMYMDMTNTIYESVNQHKEEDFWEVIEAAIIKSLGVLTGRFTLGEYSGTMSDEDLQTLDEIRWVSKYMGERLRDMNDLNAMGEHDAKLAILTSYLEGRRDLDVGSN